MCSELSKTNINQDVTNVVNDSAKIRASCF